MTELTGIYSWNNRSDYGDNIPEDIIQLQAKRYKLFEAFKENKDILSEVIFGVFPMNILLNGFL